MNRIFMLGNLGADPERNETRSGAVVTNFRLAVSERFRGQDGEQQERTTWVDVECWGRTAENVAKYCRKGRQVLVEGSLQEDRWEDKETGQKRSALKVRAFRVEFLGGNPW